MLIELFTWWKEQMRDLVPASVRSFLGRDWRPTLVAVMEPHAAQVSLILRTRKGTTALGRHGLTDGGLRDALTRLRRSRKLTAVLRVPNDLLLEQPIVLPLAAEQDLAQVVAYEMDRLTPFRADQVLWSCSATRRDPARNRLHLRISLVPRKRIEPLLAALRSVGLNPARIEAGDTPEALRSIPLLAERQRSRIGQQVEAYAMGAAGVLAVAALVLPFLQQSLALASLDERIEAIKPQVAETERLRKTIATSAATTDAITAARAKVGTPLQIVSVLTDVLPDDTYLTSLSVRQRKLTIAGRSAAAARLIGAMGAHPMIQNPAFVAPVVRDETNGGQMFSIRADLGS